MPSYGERVRWDDGDGPHTGRVVGRRTEVDGTPMLVIDSGPFTLDVPAEQVHAIDCDMGEDCTCDAGGA
jgi:hypothetical protein